MYGQLSGQCDLDMGANRFAHIRFCPSRPLLWTLLKLSKLRSEMRSYPPLGEQAVGSSVESVRTSGADLLDKPHSR